MRRTLVAVVLAVAAVLSTVESAGAAPAIAGNLFFAPGELAALPTEGPAWTKLLAAAEGELGQADIADFNSTHDVKTLAVALVAARLNSDAHRAKAADAIAAAIGTVNRTGFPGGSFGWFLRPR